MKKILLKLPLHDVTKGTNNSNNYLGYLKTLRVVVCSALFFFFYKSVAKTQWYFVQEAENTGLNVLFLCVVFPVGIILNKSLLNFMTVP